MSAATPSRQRGRQRPTAIDTFVGVRMRDRRLSLGMSQSTLGEALGLSFQQVQKYERGANRLSAGRLFELARALEVPVTFFYDGATDDPQRYELRAADRQCMELFKGFSTLRAPTRRAVLMLVNSLKNIELTADL